MLHLLGQALFGLVVGVIAKFLFKGPDPGGIIVTALMGLLGSMLGTVIGRALWGGSNYSAGWIMSILGTIILLAIYRGLTKRQAA